MMRFCGLVCEQRSYRRAIEITTETSFQKIGMIWGSNCRNDFLFLHNLALAGRAFQTKQPWKAGLRKPDSLLIGGKTNAWELEPLVLRPLLARAWKISLIWLLQQLFWVRQTNTHSFFNILSCTLSSLNLRKRGAECAQNGKPNIARRPFFCSLINLDKPWTGRLDTKPLEPYNKLDIIIEL